MKKILVIILLLTGISASSAECQVNVASMHHPRLIASDKEFKDVVKKVNRGKNIQLVRMHEAAMTEANKCVRSGKMPEARKGKADILELSRDALSQIFNCAYAFRYSKDFKYLEHAEKVLEYVCDLPDWDPKHLLSVAEMLQAVSLGYDWLYRDLDKELKKKIEDRIQHYAFDVSEDEQYNIRTFRANYNWSQVLNAAYASAALAIYEVCPERCQQILDRSITNYQEICSKFYAPDGIYVEGPGYWGFGTSYHIMMSSVLQGVYGTDFGITDIPGFDKTSDFISFMSGSTGMFNYADSWQVQKYNSWLWFFAAKYNDPSKVFNCVRLTDLIKKERLGPLAIYWASKVDPAQINEPSTRLYTGHGRVDLAIARSGWKETDTYLAIKGGLTRVTHAHMDCGSFVYDYGGVRWAREMPIPKYEVNNKGVASLGLDGWHVHRAARWRLLGYRAIDHNTIVVNGHDHLIDSIAPLVRGFDNVAEGCGATFDLSPIYGNDLAEAVRTVAIMEDGSLQVRDTLAATDSLDAAIRWNFISGAQPSIGPDGIVLQAKGQTMILQVAGADVEFKQWSIDPKDYPEDPFMAWQTKPKDTWACGFEFVIPKGEKRILKVTLQPVSN